MITILGYYSWGNLGDEAYKLAFPILLKNSGFDVRDENILYIGPYDKVKIPAETSLVICGGGDVINDYFSEFFAQSGTATCKCPIYAISVGITYPSTVTSRYLSQYDKIYVRHRAFPRELAAIAGTNNVYHIPDIAFLLPTVVPEPVATPSMGGAGADPRPVIGVFLASGFEELVEPLTNAIKSLHGYRIEIGRAHV